MHEYHNIEKEWPDKFWIVLQVKNKRILREFIDFNFEKAKDIPIDSIELYKKLLLNKICPILDEKTNS